MTLKEALDLLQQGGTLAAAVLALWAIVTRRVITRGEFDLLQKRFDEMNQINQDANNELRKQSSTNARLVEMSFPQREADERPRRTSSRQTETLDER